MLRRIIGNPAPLGGGFLLHLGGTSIKTDNVLETWENVQTCLNYLLDKRIIEKTAQDESFDLVPLEDRKGLMS